MASLEFRNYSKRCEIYIHKKNNARTEVPIGYVILGLITLIVSVYLIYTIVGAEKF